MEKSSDRSSGRSSARLSERSSVWAIGRSSDRAIERSTDRVIDSRAIDRAIDSFVEMVKRGNHRVFEGSERQEVRVAMIVCRQPQTKSTRQRSQQGVQGSEKVR